MKKQTKKKNIPQYIFIGPLPLLVCTQEVQCEDTLPSTRPQIISVAAVLGERQVGSRSKIRQCFRDQLVDVTGRILERQREIRNIIPPKFTLFHASTDPNDVDSPFPIPGMLKGSWAVVLLPSVWWQHGLPDTENYGVTEAWATLSPRIKST